MAQDMQMYRQEIFSSTNGTIESRSSRSSQIPSLLSYSDIEDLMTDPGAYGMVAH